jgi:peroxiredoxin
MRSLCILFVLAISMIAIEAYSTEPGITAAVGAAAPEFKLQEMSGKQIDLSQFKGKIVVLEWVNPFCPYSGGHYKTGNMQSLQKKHTAEGVIWLTINSTNAEHANARTNEEFAKVMADINSAATAHLRDVTGEVGKLYSAKTTPHMFVIDQNGVLAYAGALDDDRSTAGGANATVNFVSQAIAELQAGKSVTIPETKPYGCSVKY